MTLRSNPFEYAAHLINNGYSVPEALKMAGEYELWDDMLGDVSTGRRPAANFPTLAAFGPSGTINAMSFGIGDYLYTSPFHINHDIKVGSSMFPHIHWTTNGTSTNTVKWEIIYTLVEGHNQGAFPNEVTLTLEQAASGTAWQHMLTEDDTKTITALEPDTLILTRLRRITNGGSENGDTVFGLNLDLHYQKDRFGTVSKEPDFYTR